MAQHPARGGQGLHVPLEERLLLGEVAGAAALRGCPAALPSPPKGPRPQQEHRPRGIVGTLTKMPRRELLGDVRGPHACRLRLAPELPHHQSHEVNVGMPPDAEVRVAP